MTKGLPEPVRKGNPAKGAISLTNPRGEPRSGQGVKEMRYLVPDFQFRESGK
jgi:hypothetical protein